MRKKYFITDNKYKIEIFYNKLTNKYELRERKNK